MSIVLRAFDRELKRLVAIKVLAPHLAQSPLAKKRFAREAQAAAAVVHPHVLAIHQVQPGGRLPFLVMPLVAGESLAERLTAHGTLELKEVLRIGMQAAAGLAAAHEQGLVHRDVKPANILLEKGIERAVLTDFGLARAADDVTLTRCGIIAGTPQYMSPEQARGEPLDGRSDLFSLGCVLYEMATGVSPFRADSIMATMRRLVDEPPQAMASLNPELPPWFIAIVDRLLEKDPSRRFNSAKELGDLLEGCLAHVQQPVNVPLPEGLPLATPITFATSDAARRRLRPWFVAVAACLLGMGGIGAFLMATAEPSDISGQWTGDRWRNVVLEKTGPHSYTGTYTDTFGNEPGKIELKWSRIERRYNGTWSEGKDRFGKISVRQAGDEVRGAWTTSRNSAINPGTPRLADLLWVRSHPTEQASSTLAGSADMSLSAAIAAFNERAAKNPIGKDQPPLTDDEALCAIRSLKDVANEHWSAKEREQLQSIAEKRIMPAGWQFDVATTIDGADGERFQSWLIQLRTPRTDGTTSTHVIRQQMLCQLDDSSKPLPSPKVDKALLDDDATPLAAAVHAFNSSHHSVQGIRQKPLTEEEVVASIRWWKTRREEAPVTNGEFAAFQKIADTRQLPPNAAIEVISHFQYGDGGDRFIWSVRIVMPRQSKPGWTYAYEIRRHYVRAEGMDDKDKKIAWGAASPDGMQTGVRLVPHNESYVAGQQVTPIFYYRNAGNDTRDVAFPRLMTRSYYDKIIAHDSTGKAIPIEQHGPGGPVGWIQLPLPPDGLHEIRGLPILLGDGDLGSAETAIRAAAGQSIRLRFELPHPEQQNGNSLPTGDIAFSVAEL
jgi:serine/threonine protein kinase